ncbi:MAG: terminase small subunit [Oscillospiraceae bacterium]|nr:terminase small subunit [Oscillospiraceae bacterium]
MKDNDNRKKLFCCYFVKLGNIRESAVKAGFPPETAMLDGIECMRSPSCQKLISKLYSDLYCNTKGIMSGLERLAFGNSNDAVFLAFSDDLPSPDVISGLDLFNVSEIKKVKGGGVEIKLFDRQKALEKMFEFANSCDSSGIADSFINALTHNDEEAVQ